MRYDAALLITAIGMLILVAMDYIDLAFLLGIVGILYILATPSGFRSFPEVGVEKGEGYPDWKFWEEKLKGTAEFLGGELESRFALSKITHFSPAKKFFPEEKKEEKTKVVLPWLYQEISADEWKIRKTMELVRLRGELQSTGAPPEAIEAVNKQIQELWKEEEKKDEEKGILSRIGDVELSYTSAKKLVGTAKEKVGAIKEKVGELKGKLKQKQQGDQQDEDDGS